MKKFRFRLETLLGARRTAERARMEDLGREGRELAAETARLDGLVAARDETLAAPAPGDIVDLSRARLDAVWRQRLTERVHEQRRRVSVATDRTEAARHALLDAARDREVVERLRQKRADEHREEVRRDEQKTLDEVAGRIVGNNRGNTVLLVLGLIVVYLLLFTGLLKVTGILDKQIIPRMTGKPIAAIDSTAAQKFPKGALAVAAREEALARLTAERDSLAALSSRIDQKTQEMNARIALLETLKSELEAANASADSAAETGAAPPMSLADLAKVYSSMKPQELSPILARLSDDTVYGVVTQLKGRQLAKFMSALTPEKAAAMSERLAQASSGE